MITKFEVKSHAIRIPVYKVFRRSGHRFPPLVRSQFVLENSHQICQKSKKNLFGYLLERLMHLPNDSGSIAEFHYNLAQVYW